MENSKNHQKKKSKPKKKRSKQKQKAYKKHKHKQNKTNTKNKKHPKKEKKITKLSQIIQPVEKKIPKCENCHKKQSQFYCTKCEVYYCHKCEEQTHKKALKKHKKHLYKAPYNELAKKTNFNICGKHNKELSLYCTDENKLICTKCYSTCKIKKHEILGLNDFSKQIYEKIKIISNKIQKEDNQNKETIRRSLENQKKIKEKIKNIRKKIENDSALLIQKIQVSKINYLNLFRKIEIIIDTKIETILKNAVKKKKRILKNKTKIKTIKKLKKDKNHIKLITGGKEIIKSERFIQKGGKEEKGGSKEKKGRKANKGYISKKERGMKSEKKDEFDPKMNLDNRIKLNNQNKTARNTTSFVGKICGKKIYSSGKHEIKIKINKFPNPKNEYNEIGFGVIQTENKEYLIKHHLYYRQGLYSFQTCWNWMSKRRESRKCKIADGKETKQDYPEEINLKKKDIFIIFLDMDQKKISFKINGKNIGGWENLPEKVNFFAVLRGQSGYYRGENQITII
ncbi:tripartite motif-containing protein [Anaeramoeba flamelloides]|uniref:Tripartite motif-containing protein n=1 Tax=Anaeramoeba flamelloides TaxID=1746091 RepID=A0AAV8A071_9EUKA|nr:tripartite motif-containing protein [Anaeramoeba flamelloides]